jgi:tetratricopeptide (TPR) repeat protein
MEDTTRERRFEAVSEADEADLTRYKLLLTRDLIRDYPDYTPSYLQYAVALVEAGRYEEAESAIEEGMKCCPQDKLHFVYVQFGYLYEAKGDIERAIEWFKECVVPEPLDADYHSNIGQVLAKQGKFKEAEECYLTAIECPEGRIDEAYLNLGYVVRGQERFAEAIEYFEKALEIEPEFEKAMLALEDAKAALDYLEKKDRNNDAIEQVGFDW